jgi:hypothetical protein
VAWYQTAQDEIYKNNIFSNPAGTFLVSTDPADLNGNVWDYNAWFGGYPSTPYQWGGTTGTPLYSFAYWQGTLGFDTHGFYGQDPQFISPTLAAGNGLADAVNFTLAATSPFICAGANVGQTVDFFGNSIMPGCVSLGAIQYQPRLTLGAIF